LLQKKKLSKKGVQKYLQAIVRIQSIKLQVIQKKNAGISMVEILVTPEELADWEPN
jgi:hypothetical protein